MRRFKRLHDLPTIRTLQFSGVIVGRLPESNHFWIEMQFPLPFLSVEYIASIELIRAYHQSQIFQNKNKIEYMYPPMENVRNVDEFHEISTNFFNLVECYSKFSSPSDRSPSCSGPSALIETTKCFALACGLSETKNRFWTGGGFPSCTGLTSGMGASTWA